MMDYNDVNVDTEASQRYDSVVPRDAGPERQASGRSFVQLCTAVSPCGEWYVSSGGARQELSALLDGYPTGQET